jgi:putative aminopeptidase FrvX
VTRRALVVLLALALAGPGTETLPVGAVAAGGAPGDRFSADLAMGHVRILAGRIGPRPAGSRGYRRAARVVVEELEEYGYETSRMGFASSPGVRSTNVIGRWPGGGPHSILIGAHLDTVRGSPGANDNGSGVATMLELARYFAGRPEAASVRFVAFGAEEYQPNGKHHLGSAAYVRRMDPSERSELEVMVSADMIGKARPFIVGWMGIGPRAGVRAVVSAARRVGVAARRQQLPDWSDNGPFERAGMPAAFLWTGLEPNHHEPTDRVRNVAGRALRRAGRILVELIRTKA